MKKAKITRLYEIRKLNNLSQAEAAALFGVSPSYYIKIETGACKAGRGFIVRFTKLFPLEDINIFFAA
ncbi:MAG: helix-turn-helix transcriptional regulator [Eubacteriales bacterium]|nr:helix-turn-helix transcriptional regulator [Eubacteriales bacterium]